MEEMITNTTTSPNNNNTNTNTKPQPSTSLERKVRPQKDQALNCPRCNSTNTKFCYYNNYSLTQPRYFCKGCRRYWTAGGSLRNIPVGGGSRKNKRPSSSSISSSSATSKIKLSDHHHPQIQQHQHHHHHQHHVMPTNPNSKIHEQGHDLNLGFPSTLSEFMQLPNMEPPNTSNNNTSHLSALELLTGLTSSSRGLMTPFMQMQIPDPNSVFPSGFSLQGDHHFKPSLNFSLDGIGNGGGMHHHGVQESGGRILFPFEDLKSTTTTATTTTTTADHHDHQQHQHQNQNQNQHHHGDQQITRDHHHQQQQGDSTGYWTGMLGGGAGSSW